MPRHSLLAVSCVHVRDFRRFLSLPSSLARKRDLGRGSSPAMASIYSSFLVAPVRDPSLASRYHFHPEVQRFLQEQVAGRRCVSCLPEHLVNGKVADCNDKAKFPATWTEATIRTSSGELPLMRLHCIVTVLDGCRRGFASFTPNIRVLVPPPPPDEGRQHIVFQKTDRPASPASDHHIGLINHLAAVAPSLVDSCRFVALKDMELGQLIVLTFSAFNPDEQEMIADYDLVTGRLTHLAVPLQAPQEHAAASLPVPTASGIMHMRHVDGPGASSDADLRTMAHAMARASQGLLEQAYPNAPPHAA